MHAIWAYYCIFIPNHNFRPQKPHKSDKKNTPFSPEKHRHFLPKTPRFRPKTARFCPQSVTNRHGFTQSVSRNAQFGSCSALLQEYSIAHHTAANITEKTPPFAVFARPQNAPNPHKNPEFAPLFPHMQLSFAKVLTSL